jgi:hypothetical protein
MSNHFFARPIFVTILAVAAITIGCDKSPSAPTSPAAAVAPSAAPTVTAISPESGFTSFPSEIRVSGTGFVVGATVTLDGVAAVVSKVTSTEITARTPPHARGTVDVVVTNPDRQNATLPRAYTFEIVTLTVSQNVVSPGGQLTVSWVAPSGRSRLDWIGFFKVEAPSTSYEQGWWDYTDGVASGALTLTAPTQPGEYEFRYLAEDGYIDQTRSERVTISSGQEPAEYLRIP